jgi:hypothetical protein
MSVRHLHVRELLHVPLAVGGCDLRRRSRLRIITFEHSRDSRGMTLLRTLLVCSTLVIGCAGEGPVLPDLPACPGPACECAVPEDCTCMSRSACALECGDACQFHCEEDSECASACGDDCSLTCVEDTSCTLYAGERSTVTCVAATCTIEVDADSIVTCRDRGTCDIDCTGSCTVACEGAAQCTFRCSGGEPQTGSGSC